jgi:uncharacterized protein YbjT (DUF2867 family)
MTVLVAGASGVIGRAVVKALLARDEVRATVRRADAAEELRALGAKVTIREGVRADDIAEVLPRCHTLVHLTGGVEQPDPEALFLANHGSVLAAVAAAKSIGTRRIVLVSVPGANAAHAHPFLRAKGMAEDALVGSGLEHAVLRSTHAYGLGGAWFSAFVAGASASKPFVCGPGDQELAPVYADDVGAVIAAIDDQDGPIRGTWAIEGPNVVTADGLASILRDDDAVPGHADGQAAATILTDLVGAPVDAVTASFYAMPSRADAPDAAATFGVRMTPLHDGLRATVAAAVTLPRG